MKRIITTMAALAVAATAAFAQVNVSAGYSGTAMKPSAGDSQWYNGFNVGVGYNIPLGLGFEFSPSIEYNYLTRHEENTTGGDLASMTAKANFNEHYLNIPLIFNYGYTICPDARIFIFAGPTASFGLYADTVTKFEAAAGGEAVSKDKETVALWGRDNDYKRCDIRIGGGLGIDVCRHWRIQVGYDYGLINRTKTDGLKLHSHNLNAGIAYLF